MVLDGMVRPCENDVQDELRERAREEAYIGCPRIVSRCRPLSASHTRRVLSSDPDAMRVPSGEKETEVTNMECPVKVERCAPLTASHTRRVLSPDPDTI